LGLQARCLSSKDRARLRSPWISRTTIPRPNSSEPAPSAAKMIANVLRHHMAEDRQGGDGRNQITKCVFDRPRRLHSAHLDCRGILGQLFQLDQATCGVRYSVSAWRPPLRYLLLEPVPMLYPSRASSCRQPRAASSDPRNGPAARIASSARCRAGIATSPRLTRSAATATIIRAR
jgi:hypothetical protein